MTEIEKLKQRIDELEKKFENLWEQCQNDFLPNGEPNDDRIERLQHKLKRCPFCGEEARIWSTYTDWGDTYFYAQCKNSNCECESNHYLTLDEVVEGWNTRQYNEDEDDEE